MELYHNMFSHFYVVGKYDLNVMAPRQEVSETEISEPLKTVRQ